MLEGEDGGGTIDLGDQNCIPTESRKAEASNDCTARSRASKRPGMGHLQRELEPFPELGKEIRTETLTFTFVPNGCALDLRNCLGQDPVFLHRRGMLRR